MVRVWMKMVVEQGQTYTHTQTFVPRGRLRQPQQRIHKQRRLGHGWTAPFCCLVVEDGGVRRASCQSDQCCWHDASRSANERISQLAKGGGKDTIHYINRAKIEPSCHRVRLNHHTCTVRAQACVQALRAGHHHVYGSGSSGGRGAPCGESRRSTNNRPSATAGKRDEDTRQEDARERRWHARIVHRRPAD